MPEQPDYVRINVAEVTPRTAPPYARITFTERNSRYVLPNEDGDKLLVGPLGVNYHLDGQPDSDGLYLHRWDVPARRNGALPKRRR